MSDPAVQLRAVRPGEAALLRTLRLRALTDSPEVFGATLAEETAVDAAEWEARAARAAAGESETIILAVRVDGEAVGMAGGRWREPERGLIGLWGMWVDPAARNLGVGARLVLAIREWGHARGARFVRLGAVTGPAGVDSFYERLGFVAIGEERRLVRDPAQAYWEMVRPV